MSRQWYSPCHLCILFNGRTRPGKTGKLHLLGAIVTENSHYCTNSICQCPCQEKCGPCPEPLAMSASEIAWPGEKKDLDFLTQGHVLLGADRARQSELGGSKQAGANAIVFGLGQGSAWGSLRRAGQQHPGKQGQSCTASEPWHY